jgi:molybdopterin converting factor small subunit
MIIAQQNALINYRLERCYMANAVLQIIAFGPLAEQLSARNLQIAYIEGKSIQYYVQQLGAAKWLEMGLIVALNGEVCQLQSIPMDGDEIALLPPVSGG